MIRVITGQAALFLWICATLVLKNTVYAQSPFPVIFIHGLVGSADSWRDFGDILEQHGWIFGGCPIFDLDTKLVKGICNISVFIGPNITSGDFYRMQFSDNQTLTFLDQAKELSAIIDAVLTLNPGATKVILVGHSMGGLAARSYLQLLSPDDKVVKLITVGTPHLGAELAVVYQELCQTSKPSLALCNVIKEVITVEPFSLAITELRTDSLALQRLNNLINHPLPNQIEFTSIIGRGTGTPILGPPDQDGDGIVTVHSQNLASVAGASSLRHTAISIPIEDRFACDKGFIPDPVFGVDIDPLPNQTHLCEPSDRLVWLELIIKEFQISIPPGSVSLRTTLEGRTAVTDEIFTLTIFNPNTLTQVAKFTTKPGDAITGAFILSPTVSIPAGVYDILVHSPGYLKRRVNNVTLSPGVTISIPTFMAGDLNNDNLISSTDWSIMSPVWFTSSNIADINRDGIVNSIDFGFMNRNWDKTGD